jgi:cell division protein FtsQ
MSQTIKRKGTSARKAAASQGTARKVRAARARTGSALDGVMAWMPFSEAQLHRLFLAAIIGGAVALAWTVAALAGLPAMASQQIATIASDAGFEVRRVDVRGVEHLNELKVYERVLAERNQAMPLVDLGALRAELMGISWIEDARVSRQLPDTLVIDIVERKPHAVLRKPGRLVLIDATGHELEPISSQRAKGRLIVAGPGAGKQVVALSRLLGAAPALKPQVREAEWVGNRRWNLTFKTGQVLALPEGGKRSADALVAFARLDGTNRLLGGRVAAFDMRAPDRIYLRIPGRARQEAVLDAGAAARTKQQKEEDKD